MIYRCERSISIDKLNQYLQNGTYYVRIYKGIPPTAQEAREMDMDTRTEDEIGRVTVGMTAGNVNTQVDFYPTQTATATWVKFCKKSTGQTEIITTDSIGVEGTNNHVWLKTIICESGVINTFLQTYIEFDLA